MLRRKIEQKLRFWLENRKQALLIDGARQIGKTHSIEHFIQENFESVVKIDFSDRTDLIDVFALLKNSDDLIRRLSLVAGDKLIEGKTVIFFDEIQLVYVRRAELKDKGELPPNSQDILTAMKALVSKGQYRYILSGSLLGITVKDVVLNPTGYLDEYKMYPLDFEEFLWAKGVGEIAIEHVKKCFIEKTTVDPAINETLLSYFREYVLVGGMPEAVMAYTEKNNLFVVKEAHDQILNRYRQDITTYIKDDNLKLRVRDVFNAIPSQLSSKNTRYISSQVLSKAYLKHNRIEDEFLWLTSAGVAIPTYHVNEPITPLGLSAERKTL
ncbi:MAG: AAA family ATPase, partial [Bacilli bacterium]|nr:AAA family ATPase [Bacilli bacterium]